MAVHRKTPDLLPRTPGDRDAFSKQTNKQFLAFPAVYVLMKEALLLFTLLHRATGRLVTVHGAIRFDRGIEENKAFTREGLQ